MCESAVLVLLYSLTLASVPFCVGVAKRKGLSLDALKSLPKPTIKPKVKVTPFDDDSFCGYRENLEF